MKRRTISDLIRYRFWGKTLIFLTGFIIATLVFQFVVVRNPKETKAATINVCDYGNDLLYNWDGNHFLTQRGYAWNTMTLENADVLVQPPSGTCTLSLFGNNNFNSLTIDANGIVTHDAFGTGELGATSNTKIDLVVAETVELRNGGKIDVSNKGYRGDPDAGDFINGRYGSADTRCGWDFGCGADQGTAVPVNAGASSYFSDNDTGGGGGAHGGAGGIDAVTPFLWAMPKAESFDSITEPIEPGAGGGSATDIHGPDQGTSPGGSGGGRVKISAKTIIVRTPGGIYANGETISTPGGTKAYGGAGAGGSIWLKSQNGEFPALGYPNVDGGSSSSIGGSAGNVKMEFAGGLNIEAKGGNGNGRAGGGGGGLIAIYRIALQNPTIRKTLETVSVKSGNPYALQLGDIIKVKLSVTNLVPNKEVVIKDLLLNAQGGERCKINDFQNDTHEDGSSFNAAITNLSKGGDNGNGNEPYIFWKFTPVTSTETSVWGDLWYECTVSSP